MINILPYNQKQLIRRIRSMRITIATLWAGSIILAASVALFVPTLQTINSRHAIVSTQIKKLEASGTVTKTADVVSLERRVKAVKEKLAAPLPTDPTVLIDQLRAYQTAGIRLTGYDLATDKPVVQLHGTATDRQSLQQFVATLQRDQSIGAVDSPIANFVKSSQSEFTVTVTFKSV